MQKYEVLKDIPVISYVIVTGLGIWGAILNYVKREEVQGETEKRIVAQLLTLMDGLKKNKHIIPPIVNLMFTIGEETGSMETVLEKIGLYYDDQVGVAVDTLIGLIEPLMIVVMGSIVTTLALAMFLPMFDMGKNIG